MQTLLIIGGTGDLGNILVRKLHSKFSNIIVYSRNEDKQWSMRIKYKHLPITYIIGDMADSKQLKNTLLRNRPTHIIIAAALKHVDICEHNVSQSIKTNIYGIETVIDCINDVNLPKLESVLFISTDKACSPVNTYGMCKAIGEKIILDKSAEKSSPRFVIVRHGNMINSRDSLLSKLNRLADDSECKVFPVTNPDMTRFFMSLDESVKLIEYALFNGRTGYTYIPKTKSYRIIDIVNVFSEHYDKPVKIVGSKPDEKIHETLINDVEMKRTVKEGEYLAIKPFYSPVPTVEINKFPCGYSSDVCLDDDLQNLFDQWESSS